jgi:hypothetical protein
MEHGVILRHRETGLYLGSPAGVTADPCAALRFPSRGEAERFLAVHACEPGALEAVAERPRAAA